MNGGVFDEELVAEEITQVRMGKIIRDRYPELDLEDQEAVRQHAIAALNMVQQAGRAAVAEEGQVTDSDQGFAGGGRHGC